MIAMKSTGMAEARLKEKEDFFHSIMPEKKASHRLKLSERLLPLDLLNCLPVIPVQSLQICLRGSSMALNILSVLTKA